MPLTHPLERTPVSVSGDALNLRVEVRPGVPAVAEISGEIDIMSASWLRETLLLVIRHRGPSICVDLQGVTFIDCSGIGALIATARRARIEGGQIRVIRASASARRVITLLGLQPVLMCQLEQAPVKAGPKGRSGTSRADSLEVGVASA